MKPTLRLGLHFLICLVATFACATGAVAQTPQTKPLLIIQVEDEGINLTQPANVESVSPAEIKELRLMLEHDLGGMFQIIPESDKRDCIELGVTIEKAVARGGVFYVGSSEIAIGKGEDDLLYTHNAIYQPTLKKVSAAITFQLSVMSLQAAIPGATKGKK